MMPTPPRNSSAKVTRSNASALGAESNHASRKWSGEKISDCGSLICGQPAKTLGVQNGDWPVASERARNDSCGRNCDSASHGMVTAPDSHGQAGSMKAMT